MTAAAELGPTDLAAARSREELRLASVASGRLMLLDAHHLTGRLPLDVQVQASRLRHAVKLAIQAEALRPAAVASPPAAAGVDPAAAALRAWIATQPWTQPGPMGWVYLLCFRDPTTGQHQPSRATVVGVSTPATTGAGPRTWSAASTASIATPAGPGRVG